MTTIHAQMVGAQALIPRDEFEQLIALARQTDKVELQTSHDDWPITGLMKLAEESGSFDFWDEPGEHIYSLADGEPV